MNTSNGLGMFGMLMWFLSILLMASTVGFLGDAVQSNLGEVSLSLIRFLPPTPVCQPSEYCFQNADEEMTTKCKECKPLSACNQWQYEHARPTRTSDRLCFRASPRCPATTFGMGAIELELETAMEAILDERARYMWPREWNLGCAAAGKDRFCSPLQECGDGTGDGMAEYEAEPPTSSTDRVCFPITACNTNTINPECDGATEHETQPLTATTDRVCTPHTAPCTADEFESASPTSELDRVCTPRKTCGRGEFVARMPPHPAKEDNVCEAVAPECDSWVGYESNPHQSATATISVGKNRVCTPFTTCKQGVEYELEAPTPSTDRVCKAGTVCRHGHEYETYPIGSSFDRTCQRLTICGPAEVEEEAPTPTRNRKCTKLDCENAEPGSIHACANGGECMITRAGDSFCACNSAGYYYSSGVTCADSVTTSIFAMASSLAGFNADRRGTEGDASSWLSTAARTAFYIVLCIFILGFVAGLIDVVTAMFGKPSIFATLVSGTENGGDGVTPSATTLPPIGHTYECEVSGTFPPDWRPYSAEVQRTIAAAVGSGGTTSKLAAGTVQPRFAYKLHFSSSPAFPEGYQEN
eukprot:gene22147-19215_t